MARKRMEGLMSVPQHGIATPNSFAERNTMRIALPVTTVYITRDCTSAPTGERGDSINVYVWSKPHLPGKHHNFPGNGGDDDCVNHFDAGSEHAKVIEELIGREITPGMSVKLTIEASRPETVKDRIEAVLAETPRHKGDEAVVWHQRQIQNMRDVLVLAVQHLKDDVIQ